MTIEITRPRKRISRCVRGICARPLFAVMLLWGSESALQGQVEPWWGGVHLRPGPSPVGFATQILRDTSRGSGPHHPRLVQLAVWYPSSESGVHRLTYADYLGIQAAETTTVFSPELAKKNVESNRAFLASHSTPDSVITRWFSSPMLAVENAPAARGPFPIVLVAQGNGQSAVDQSVLGEYLASYGYVVATSPSQARITGQPDSEANVGPAAEDQADDLALIRSALRPRVNVVQTGFALVGHSFGARSALLYAMRDSTAGCIVSLDGGIGTATARTSYESARSFRPVSVHAALLHFYEELDPPMTPDWGTLRRLVGSEVLIAKTTGLHHHHFTALGSASGRFPELGKATGATSETAGSYAGVLELTRAFLDANIRHDTIALGHMKSDSSSIHPERLPK